MEPVTTVGADGGGAAVPAVGTALPPIAAVPSIAAGSVPAAVAAPLPGPVGVARGRSSRRDRLADAGFAVFSLLAVVAGPAPLVHGWDGQPHLLRVADVLAGTVAIGAICARRRSPVGFALLAAAVGAFSTLGGFVPLVAAYSVAALRRWQVAAPLGALLALSSVPVLLLYPHQPAGFVAALVGAVALTVAATAWGMFTRARRMLIASLRERAERAEAEQALRADRTRRAERQRIAREMHDVLAHRLSLLAVHAGALEFRPDAAPADVARTAGVIRSNAREALEELRDVVSVLREDGGPGVPDRPQPTLADLPELVADARHAGTRVDDRIELEVAEVPRATGRTVYRIVQEALTNGRKHAPRSAVGLTVAGSPAGGVSVEVRTRLAVDREADPMPVSGRGLVGLTERAELSGGSLVAGAEGGDFVVRAWVPWSGETRP